MIIKVNDIDLRVLGLFTKGYDKELYIREVEKLLGVSSRTALLTLDKLERIGVLESQSRGKIKLYRIRKTVSARDYFVLVEQYKKMVFLAKNRVIAEIFEKIEGTYEGICVVFGSYAKGREKKDSDLDVLMVGKYNKNKIWDIGKTYGFEINIKGYSGNILEKDIKEDLLLKEVVENHIILEGVEEFVKTIARWKR